MDEEEDEKIVIEYEVVRKQRYVIETAREFVRDVEPWKTDSDEVDDEQCITVEEFSRWRRRLLKILGVASNE